MRPEMPQFQPRDPDYAVRVRASFDLQQAMALIGAELAVVEPGYVEIHLPHRAEVTQQHGGVRTGQHSREVGDPDPGERPAHTSVMRMPACTL